MLHVKHEPLPPPEVSRETSERLDRFLRLVAEWSCTINLVARGDIDHLQARHLRDSLQILPLLPATGDLIDLGSGAGFPGLVLAICVQRPVHLVEADHRKAAFLREAARICAAPAIVHAARIDGAVLPPAAAVTARALAPLLQLVRWSAPLLAPAGMALFHKGRQAEQELTHAAAEWQMQIRRWRSVTDPNAVILQVSHMSRHAAQPH